MKNQVRTLEANKWYYRKWRDGDKDVFFVKSISGDFFTYGDTYRNGRPFKGDLNHNRLSISTAVNDPRYKVRLALECEIPQRYVMPVYDACNISQEALDQLSKLNSCSNKKYPNGGLIPPPPPKPVMPKLDFLAKAKETHNAYSDYKQLLKQKDSIREALRECTTRIEEAENNLINILNS